ncbi:MAG: ABC transporter ATP-binding protein [Myxococcaceae bacterium]|nr:ABC transporter ATP-binding protein [Myxococcaceae bacterium]
MDAIVIRNVVKHFRKSTIRREYTTFKSELVRWLTGKRDRGGTRFIEALRGIDLVIPRGKTVGIIGRNGSGKSTLLKLMTGIYSPTSGSIDINGRISALLDLGAGFHPDFSGRENILINGIILGMSRVEIRARMDDIIAFSELGDFIDEPVRTYSSGMYMRLAFSVATHVDPDILIIDEILAVGDEHFGKKSLGKMTEFKKAGKTIVLVTHDLSTIERWCDLAAWIDAGRIRRMGAPGEVVDEYRRAVALAEEQAQVMVPAALAADGGALPQVQAAPPATRPEVEISEVRLLGSSGAPVSTLGAQDPLEVAIHFTARMPVEEVGFSVVLHTKDGVRVYGTSTFREQVPLPTPLPPAGVVRLRLERVGLSPGHYTLDVSAHSAEGREYSAFRDRCRLSVEASGEGQALPPHRWTVEPAPEALVSSAPLAQAVTP